MQRAAQVSVDVVWFKQDLRIRDHAPLAQALREGRRVVLLHTFEQKTSHTHNQQPPPDVPVAGVDKLVCRGACVGLGSGNGGSGGASVGSTQALA